MPAPRIPSGPERTDRFAVGLAFAVAEAGAFGFAYGLAVGLWGLPKDQRLTHGFEGSP